MLFLLLCVLTALTGGVEAADVVYVTDLSIFTYLAPCAASAVSQNIHLQASSSLCASDVAGLQSCVCSQQYDVVTAGMAKSVSSSCGATATEDQASAQTVLDAYCTQSESTFFPTPTHPVSSYIWELPGFIDLAPCAQTGLYNAIQYNTYYECPDDETGLASCACTKNANRPSINNVVSKSVRDRCSSHADDMTSAAAMFTAYCALGDGITSFPSPATADPTNGGLVSYYMTDMPQFAALPSCAASAAYYALSYQRYDYCGNTGPQAWASCACIKTDVSKIIARSISSNARSRCSSSVGDSVSSATAFFDFYCSAARAEVTVTGVQAAVTSRPSRTPDALASAKSSILAGMASSTATPPARSSLSPRDKMIIGAVVGSVGFVLLVAGILFCLARRGRKRYLAWEERQQAQAQAAQAAREAEEAQEAQAKVVAAEAAAEQEAREAADQAAARDAAAGHDHITAADSADNAPPAYDAGTYGAMFHVQKPS